MANSPKNKNKPPMNLQNISQRFKIALCAALAVSLAPGMTQASTNIFNFDSDPSGVLTIRHSADTGVDPSLPGQWLPSGGSTLETGETDQSTNGYLAITQTTDPSAAHGMRSTIVFDDFDNGLVVAGFTFSCDVRIGAGSATPADGFSINFARSNDPAITTESFGNGPGDNPVNGQEEGTTTGLAISFDAYANTASDPIGLTVKVDNTVVTNIPMTTLNGGCTNINSLQTGPATTNVADLCWQPLSVNLQPNGLLNVAYKGVVLLTNFQTLYTPSAGRLIFAGRTGGSYQEQDVDNIKIITLPSGSPIVAATSGNANGFRFNINDSGFATPDTNTITVKLDGVSVTPTAITQTGNPGGGNGVTIIGYQNTGILLSPGSVHTNLIQFSGSTFNGTVTATNVFTVAAYTTLAASQKAPGAVNTNLTGFTGRVHQLSVPRTPNPTNIAGIERELANLYLDPNTGNPYDSIAETNVFTNSVINWYKDQVYGGTSGFFNYNSLPPASVPDDPIPGIDPLSAYGTDNGAAEILTELYLPVGAYQLGVNHDDGFKLFAGAEPRDVLASTVLGVSAGSGDTSPMNIVVTNAGYYPFRLIWGQNTGAAQLEFYLIDFATGQRILINDLSQAVHVAAYADTNALTLPYVRWVSPAPGDGGDPRLIVAKLEDGTGGTVIPNSISLTLNGTGNAVITKTNTQTTVTLVSATPPPGTNAAVKLVYNTSAGGPITNTWNFVSSYFGQTMFNIPVNEGSGTNLHELTQGLLGGFVTNNPFWTNDSPSGSPKDFSVSIGGPGRKGLIPDPSHFITLGPDTSSTNGDYTLQAWVKLPVGFEPAARMIIYSYEGVPGVVFSINTGRTLHTTTFGLNDVNSTLVIPNDNQWHHVAVEHINGVSMRFFMDGTLGSEISYTRGPGSRTSFTISVGGSVANNNNSFTGNLARLRMTKGALDVSQFDYPIPVAVRINTGAGNTITLSWLNSGGNLVPQSTDKLLPSGTVWTDVVGTVVTTGSTNTVTDTNPGTGKKYYRLRPGP